MEELKMAIFGGRGKFGFGPGRDDEDDQAIMLASGEV